MEISLKCLVFGILLFKIPSALSYYPKYVVEDNCRLGNEKIFYNFTKLGSVGTLVSSDRPPYQPNKNCSLILQPPSGLGIVASVRKVDFRQASLYCLDYLKIWHSDYFFSPTTLCRFKHDPKERTSYYSKGKMNILYHVDSQLRDGLGLEEGFALTFTVVTEEIKDCLEDDMYMCNNGRCIPSSLQCDGHNNCGDNSDEELLICDVPENPFLRFSDILYGIAICVFILIVTSSCVVFAAKRRRRNLDADSLSEYDEPTTRIAPYQSVHPSGYFISQNPAGATPLYPPQLKNIQSDGGFANPCYPSGYPQAPPPYSQ